MKENIGVLLSPFANKRAVRWVKEKNPSVLTHCCLIPREDTLRNLPERIALVGGDGFVRTCINEIYETGELKLIGIIPGGTNNMFHRALAKSGKVISLEEFRDSSNPLEKEDFKFKPGNIAGTIFVAAAGFGRFEEKLASFSESLRHPKSNRYSNSLAGLVTLFSSSFRKPKSQSLVDFFFTVPYIGPYRISQEQKHPNNLLGRAAISGESHGAMILKLITALLYWQVNLLPPSNILDLKYAESFSIETEKRFANLDGNNIKLPPTFSGEVKRHETPIPIAALKL